MEPALYMEGTRWNVSNYKNSNVDIHIVNITILQMRESVCLYNCTRIKVIISSKCASISIDNCQHVEVIFESLLGALEIINSKKLVITCINQVSSISIDSSDGVFLNLSRTALDVRIVTCKSTEMNVSWPNDVDSEKRVERAIPQQFEHSIMGGNIVSKSCILY
jgi:adenylyl cyclase-associated protein